MTTPTDPIDLDHYQWRVRTVVGDASETEGSPGYTLIERLLIPCSDPRLYEQPADGMFHTVDEALAYIEDFGFRYEYDPDTWVLVHYTGQLVSGVRLEEQA